MLLCVTFIYCTGRGGVTIQWPLNNKIQGPNVVKHEVFQGTWFPKSRWWPICSFKGHSLTLRGLQHFGGTCLSCSCVLPHPHHQNPTGFHPFVNGCLSMNLNYLTNRSLPYISNCTTSPTFKAISSKVVNTMFWSDLLFVIRWVCNTNSPPNVQRSTLPGERQECFCGSAPIRHCYRGQKVATVFLFLV